MTVMFAKSVSRVLNLTIGSVILINIYSHNFCSLWVWNEGRTGFYDVRS